MADIQEAAAGAREGALAETLVERACRLLAEIAMVAMLLVIGVDILTRSLLNFSFEVSDELGGYMVVAITFFSLAVCQAGNAFHRVGFLLDRLSPRGQAAAKLVFDLAALTFAAVLIWQFWNFEAAAFRSERRAPTYLMTPMWIAQLPMVLGVAAYIFTLLRSLLHGLRAVREAGTGAGGAR